MFTLNLPLTSAIRSRLEIFSVVLLFTIISVSSTSSQAQDIEFANLFFTPVPLSQADLITLNAGGYSDSDIQSAIDAIPRFQTDISQMEADDPANPELITLLNTLGLAQQTSDQHEDAIETFNRAAAIAVDIYGENSLQQAPMLEQSILSHLKLNNINEITDIEEFLYELRSMQYEADSTEMYNAMTTLADWYSSAYMKTGYLAREPGFIPRVTSANRARRLAPNSGDTDSQAPGLSPESSTLNSILTGNIRDVSINDVIDINLRKLESLYEDYQDSYTSNTTLSTVVDVARRIARLSYHAEQEMNFEREGNIFEPNYTGSREQAVRNSEQRRDESYDVGKIALEYIVDLIQSVEGVGVQQTAIALLDLGDWELAYGLIPAAQSNYMAAYEALRELDIDDATIDDALSNVIPVAIPRIASFPATQQTSGTLGLIQNPNYAGYIDVSFTIDERGNSNDITILGSSDGVNPRIQAILENQIKLTKYRPILRGGELIAQDATEYRYYFSL